MTLYLKYRPKTLDELDITSVRDTLKKIVQSGNIPHAFLFSGPRGLGKTSAARIIAKIVNCENLKKDGEPCNKCNSCKSITTGSNLDVIELDAASHRGIDDIRVLREGVALAPAQGKKKVYIIDEAHMLTLEASNALLKTLEEPPSHVMFILATTNPEKLIDTIKSRATNIVFKKPSKEELLRSMDRVIKSEKLQLDKERIISIVEASGGSFRDAVKILETQDFIEDIKTNIDVDKFLNYLFQEDAKGALVELETVVTSGVSIDVFTKKVLERLRKGILSACGLGQDKIEGVELNVLTTLTKTITDSLSLMAYAPIEELPLEIAIVEWCGRNLGGKTGLKDEAAPEIISTDKFTEEKEALTQDLDSEIWSKILSAAKPRNKSVEALLRSARPVGFDGSVLTLGVYYSFHKERLEAQPHRQILDEIIREVFGKNIRIVCTLTAPSQGSLENVKTAEGVVLTESNVNNEVLTKDDPGDIIKLAKEMFGN